MIHPDESMRPAGRQPRAAVVTALATLLTLSCSEEPPAAPELSPAVITGSLAVVATVTGVDVDGDGFDVRVDGGSPRWIAGGSALAFADLVPGRHTVSVEHIASNCVLEGSNPHTVIVLAREVTVFVFDVACFSRSNGFIRVQVLTPGFDRFSASLDDGSFVNSEDGIVLFTDLLPGPHFVRLQLDAGVCVIDGSNPQPVTVTASQVAGARFTLTCPSAAGSLLISVTTTGAHQPREYQVYVQQSDDYYCYSYTCQWRVVNANGTVRFDGLPLVLHYVALQLVPRNCTVTPGFQTVLIRDDRSADAAFAVSCS
ncbi:MAG: hypothetical protein L0271_01405 [Gemmatimonadetes bacterium]|nr:hypothetical protein [Gemmatimonadota bacterium]